MLFLTDCVLEEEIDYSFNNLPGHIPMWVKNFQDCATMCYKEAGCKFWTWNKGSYCSLKTSLEGKDYGEGAVSGQKACGFDVQLATSCKDFNPYCPEWAKQGECDSRTSNTFMHNNCKKSCSICIGRFSISKAN